MNNSKENKLEDLPTIDQKSGKRIVYIIYNKKSIKCAEIARNLISRRKDIKCSIIYEEILYKNYTVTSDNICIFVGNLKNISESRKLAANARVQRKYGIHYGWSGRQAFVWNESYHFTNEEKKSFIIEYKREFGKIESKYSIGEFCGDAAMMFAFGLLGLISKKGVEKVLKNKKIIIYGLQKYVMPLAIVMFINKELENFINQAIKGA